MENSAAEVDQEAIRTQQSDNECGVETNDCAEQKDSKGNGQKDMDSLRELNSVFSNEIPDSQIDESLGAAAACSASEIGDRPTSLRLESVLEYTSKIKSFLGLRDESEEVASNLPPDPNWKRLPSSLCPLEGNETQDSAESTSATSQSEAGKSDDAENQITEDISGVNQETVDLKKEEILDSDRNGNRGAELETSSTLENELFSGVVKINEISPENSSKDDAPEDVKSNNIHRLPFSENSNVPIVVLDDCNVFSVEEKPNTLNLGDKNVQDLKDSTDREIGFSADDIIMSNREQRLDAEPLRNIHENAAPNPSEGERSEVEDSRPPVESPNSSQHFFPSKENIQALNKHIILESPDNFDVCEGAQSTGSQNGDMEETYQVIHIEEGLRKVEKEIKECEQPKDSDVNKTINSDSAVLEKKSSQNIEDIRRLSCEVVNFVLQSAGEEVQHILRERNSVLKMDSFREENKNLECTSVKQSPDNEMENREDHNKDTGVSSDDSQKESGDTALTSSIGDTIEMEDLSKYTNSEQLLQREESDSDLECGFGNFRPRCLQRFATSGSYLALYSVIGILHGSYYTYLVGVLSTLEKRFSFKSKTSGLIMILDELTPLFLGVLVGHFANRVHRPRLVSFGMFLSAFCCFASALPYFLYGTASHLTSTAVHNRTGVEVCDGDPRTELCSTDDRPPTVTAIVLLMLGSFLKGFGNLAYYAIGLAYLDDNAKKKNTPLYFAVAFALRLLGPMAGFLMSSAFLKYYENPLDHPGFGPEDPRWIGGWWMGFVLQGILLIIFAGPLALFPRSLPGHKQLESATGSLFDVSGLLDALKRLAKNPLYVLIICNTVLTIYGNFGFYIMSPKYMENQFRLTASSASLFAGPPGIAAFMVSTVIGGYLIWRFKPTAKFLAGGLVFLEIVSTIGYLLLMIPQCDRVEMAHFGYGEESLVLEGGCNADCNCSTVSFTPVCGPDGESYFSPCYAGCRSYSDQKYSECSCVDGAFKEVTRGLCFSDACAFQAMAYIITLPILQLFVNSLRVANTMILLRSVRPEDKNIALGVFETILSTVAFIPFPILYGALIDSTCLVWEESCGETGNCWFYDIQRFNYFIHGASALFCGLSVFNLLAIYLSIHRVGDLYEEEKSNTHFK